MGKEGEAERAGRLRGRGLFASGPSAGEGPGTQAPVSGMGKKLEGPKEIRPEILRVMIVENITPNVFYFSLSRTNKVTHTHSQKKIEAT